MYGFWQLTLIGLAIMIISLVLAFVFRHLDDKYYSVCWYGLMVTCWILHAVIGIATFIILLCAIFNPMCAKNEYNKFQAQKVIIEQTIENGTDLENISISQTIIEYNNWIASAKASKKTYGIFSSYYYLDLDKLQPITKGGNGNG